MKYNPENTVTHCCKLYVEARSPFMYNLIFVMRKDSKMECFLYCN